MTFANFANFLRQSFFIGNSFCRYQSLTGFTLLSLQFLYCFLVGCFIFGWIRSFRSVLCSFLFSPFRRCAPSSSVLFYLFRLRGRGRGCIAKSNLTYLNRHSATYTNLFFYPILNLFFIPVHQLIGHTLVVREAHTALPSVQ